MGFAPYLSPLTNGGGLSNGGPCNAALTAHGHELHAPPLTATMDSLVATSPAKRPALSDLKNGLTQHQHGYLPRLNGNGTTTAATATNGAPVSDAGAKLDGSIAVTNGLINGTSAAGNTHAVNGSGINGPEAQSQQSQHQQQPGPNCLVVMQNGSSIDSNGTVTEATHACCPTPIAMASTASNGGGGSVAAMAAVLARMHGILATPNGAVFPTPAAMAAAAAAAHHGAANQHGAAPPPHHMVPYTATASLSAVVNGTGNPTAPITQHYSSIPHDPGYFQPACESSAVVVETCGLFFHSLSDIAQGTSEVSSHLRFLTWGLLGGEVLG